MTEANQFTVEFWGVRGTLPTAGAATLQYGGNTSCIYVRCAGHSFILDAGTGITLLADALQTQNIDILLSHTHIDHILGLPFFAPAYHSSRRIRLWAGHLKPTHTLRGVVEMLMQPPLFPLTPNDFKADVQYHDFVAGEELYADEWSQFGIRIKTCLLAHPDRATGYRIEQDGKSVCYITDYEHTLGIVDPALVDFVRGADCMIYDATYTDEEFEKFKGWGHSTWQQGVRIAEAGNVKKLVLFHHNPEASDAILHARTAQILAALPGTLLAKEGLVVQL